MALYIHELPLFHFHNNHTYSTSSPTSMDQRLQVSKAYTLANYETINDKVLREMNERAKVEGCQSQSTSRPRHTRTTSSSSTASIAAAAAVKSPKVRGHHKRYSSVHRRQFAKMDSIANHYTTMRPRKPSPEESPEQKRTAAHNRELTSSAMKRRRTDAEGGKVELGLSGVRDKGRALFRRMRNSDERRRKSDENNDNDDKVKPNTPTTTTTKTKTAATTTDSKVLPTKGNVKISTVPLNDTVSGSGGRLRASKSMTRLNGAAKNTEPSAAGGLKQSKSTGRGLSRLTQDTTASLSKMTDKKLSKSKSYASLSPSKKAPLSAVSPSRVDDMLNQLPNTTHAPERTAKMLNKLAQPPSKIPTRTQRLNNAKSTPNLRKQH